MGERIKGLVAKSLINKKKLGLRKNCEEKLVYCFIAG